MYNTFVTHKFRFVLLTYCLVLMLGVFVARSSIALAATASVAITVVKVDGGVIPNMQISCLDTPPDKNGWPQPPNFHYPTTDSGGNATWSVNYRTDYDYKCYPRSAVSPDGCYSFAGTKAKVFDFSSSLNQSVTFTGQKNVDAKTSCSTGSVSQPNSNTQATAAPAKKVLPPNVKLESIKIGGNTISEPVGQGATLHANKGNAIVLSGSSTSVTEVIITVHSETKTYKGKVNKNGEWTVKIPTSELDAEEHTVEIGSSNHKKPFKTLALDIKIPAVQNSVSMPSKTPFVIRIIIAALIVCALFAFIFRTKLAGFLRQIKSRLLQQRNINM